MGSESLTHGEEEESFPVAPEQEEPDPSTYDMVLVDAETGEKIYARRLGGPGGLPHVLAFAVVGIVFFGIIGGCIGGAGVLIKKHRIKNAPNAIKKLSPADLETATAIRETIRELSPEEQEVIEGFIRAENPAKFKRAINAQIE